MTREQQRKLREIKQAMPKLLKAAAKEYGFKKIDYMIWYNKGDMFFTLFLFERELDNKCWIDIEIACKPLWIDDLFWDIMDMSENKKEPLSLRGVGAFTVRGVKLYEEEVGLENWSLEEAQACVSYSMQKFAGYIKTVTVEDFLEHHSSDSYHSDLRTLLVMIHKGEYERAIAYAKDMDSDCFANGSLGLRAGVIRYCKN